MLRRLLILTSAILVCNLAIAQTAGTLNLLPVPQNISLQEGTLSIDNSFSICVKADATDTVLYKAVTRMYQALNRKTGLYFKQQRITPKDQSDTAILQITVAKKAVTAIGIDESYSIDITTSKIILNAPNTLGALHGLETLLQLAGKKDGNFYFPLVTIKDTPRFEWRGLMIDPARHFIPIDVLQRNIDAMATVKMNVLHLHLTDNEGFRIESKVLPQLHQKGSYGEYYTQAQMKELITYSADRGIIIVPEFDMPGHTKSWFAGCPELSSQAGMTEPGPAIDFTSISAANPGAIMQLMQTAPFPAMDPSKESTYALLDKFIAEMSALFPSPYLHIGADENNGVVWKNNPAIVAFMQKNKIPDTHALQAYFVSRVSDILRKHKKQPVGWEELFSKDLAKDVTVQVWQNNAFLKQALDKGNPVLLSKGFYLDLFMPAYTHYNNADLPADKTSANSNLRGGEAAIWTEIADGHNIETRVWPRAAAIAERLWSPASVTDVDDMYRRLFVLSDAMDENGLQHTGEYERSIRSYAGNENPDALRNFFGALTPVKGYKKISANIMGPGFTTYLTRPLNAVSDILPVDNAIRWQFHAAVKNYIGNHDEASATIIRNYLINWQSCNGTLQPLFSNNNSLKAVQPLAENLSKAAGIGLEALDKMQQSSKPADDWIKEKADALKAADKPYAETELSILADIIALVKQQPVPLPASYSPF